MVSNRKRVSVNLDDRTVRAVDKLAARHSRSREGEMRWLITEAVRQLELVFNRTGEWTAVAGGEAAAAARRG